MVSSVWNKQVARDSSVCAYQILLFKPNITMCLLVLLPFVLLLSEQPRREQSKSGYSRTMTFFFSPGMLSH